MDYLFEFKIIQVKIRILVMVNNQQCQMGCFVKVFRLFGGQTRAR